MYIHLNLNKKTTSDRKQKYLNILKTIREYVSEIFTKMINKPGENIPDCYYNSTSKQTCI